MQVHSLQLPEFQASHSFAEYCCTCGAPPFEKEEPDRSHCHPPLPSCCHVIEYPTPSKKRQATDHVDHDDDDDDACLAIFFRGPQYHWSSGVSLVQGRHFRVRRRLCCSQTESPTMTRTSTARECCFLMEESESRPIIGQEKRIIVQSFVHFQQFSRPGAKGNTFARIPEEPRCEAAAPVMCQRKDFIEHRPAGCSPRPRPQTCVRSPPVDPSWTCWCTARLAHHKTSPQKVATRATAFVQGWRPTLLNTRLRSARGTRHADKRWPG